MSRRAFGRTAYEEPLVELGPVEDGEDVLTAFPQEWVELVTIPESAMHWIIRDGEEVEDERIARARG